MPQELISQFNRNFSLPIETYRQLGTISQRDAIPTNRRWEGMIVYVITEGLSYILVGGVDNSQWVELGTLVDVEVVDNLLSTSQTDALSANQGRVLKGLIDNIDVDISWGNITGTLSNQTDLQNALNDKQDLSEKGQALGYTPLDSGAKVPLVNLPDSILGQVSYQGTWDPSTNVPTLTSPTTSATKGHYYVCTANGTRFGLNFSTGDWVISDGSIWDKVDNSDAVTTVFGRMGNIVANTGDYTFAQIGSKPTTIGGYGITDFNSLGDARWLGLTGGTLTGNLIAPIIVANGSSNPIRIVGTGLGNANQAYLTFFESNATVQQGYVGFGSASTSDMFMLNSVSGTNLRISGSGGVNGLSYYDGSGYRTIWNTGNLTPFTQSNADGRYLQLTGGSLSGPLQFDTFRGWQLGSGAQPTIQSFSNGTNNYFDLWGNLYIRDNTTIRFTFNRSTGNFTSTGSITAASFKTTNWEIVETGGVLQFKQGGTVRFQMKSTGIIEATNFKLGLV